MDGQVTAAFIGIVSGIISSLVASSFTTRLGYKQLYADNVSTSRMDWINNFREEIGAIVAGLRYRRRRNYQNKTDDIIYQAEKARVKLLTRLNQDTSKLGNEYNKVMTDILSEIDFGSRLCDNEYYENTLIELSRKILEPEWEKVKLEAGGKEK